MAKERGVEQNEDSILKTVKDAGGTTKPAQSPALKKRKIKGGVSKTLDNPEAESEAEPETEVKVEDEVRTNGLKRSRAKFEVYDDIQLEYDFTPAAEGGTREEEIHAYDTDGVETDECEDEDEDEEEEGGGECGEELNLVYERGLVVCATVVLKNRM